MKETAVYQYDDLEGAAQRILFEGGEGPDR